MKIELLGKNDLRQIGPNLWLGDAIIRCLDCGATRPTPTAVTLAADMTWIGRPTDNQIMVWVHRGAVCIPVLAGAGVADG